MRATVWGEGWLDLNSIVGDPPLKYADYAQEARRIYPQGVHGAIAAGLARDLGALAHVEALCLDDEGAGLDPAVLDDTDVLIWWSHVREHLVADEAVARVRSRVLEGGMGLVVLHSGAQSRLFRGLVGSEAGTGGWRQSDDWEAVWTAAPHHDIARGVGPVFVLPTEEVWCEPFDIPEPEELVFISTFRGGEVFRSGCCFERGAGRIFYFRPGHESHPTFHNPAVSLVLANAVRWAARWAPAEPPASVSVLPGVNSATKELAEGWWREG